MDQKVFNELFEMSETDLQELKGEVFARWTFETGTPADREYFEAIETVLLARERTGLHR